MHESIIHILIADSADETIIISLFIPSLDEIVVIVFTQVIDLSKILYPSSNMPSSNNVSQSNDSLKVSIKNSAWKFAYFKIIVALVNQWNFLSLFRFTGMGFIYSLARKEFEIVI